MGIDKAAFRVGDKVKVHTVDGVGEVALIIPPLCEPRREVFRSLPIGSGVKVAIRHADEGKDTLRDHVSYIVQFYRSGLTFYSWPKVKNITLADKGGGV